MTIERYEELRLEVRRLQKAGALPTRPTREERIDWAYGNTVIENPKITPAIVEGAYEKRTRP